MLIAFNFNYFICIFFNCHMWLGDAVMAAEPEHHFYLKDHSRGEVT